MALQYSVAVRNAQLDAFETAIGSTAILRIRSGAVPANCAAAETAGSVVLAEMTLPSTGTDWMTNAASGSKSKNGTWEDTSANATGTAGYFRIYDSTGNTCHAQGTVTATGGGGDMTLDNTSIAIGQAVTVTSFTISAGNA